MILCSLISASPTSSAQVAISSFHSHEPWNEGLSSVNCLGTVGSRSLRYCHSRKQAGTVERRALTCQAAKEIEVDSASSSSSDDITGKANARANLAVGSPIVVVEAPPLLKTAEPMPMMRPNKGLIKAGDAGRIIDRKPKDVWAVRFVAGAYLIDGKYFEPLLEE